jgi:homocitrate synthase NifV
MIDTTLRDGEQAPGVAFSVDQKVEIARLLDQLGVDEVEAGTPVIGKEEQEAIGIIARAGFSFLTSCWCRARTDDILQAATLGTQSVNISLPVSDIQISSLGKSRDWVMKELKLVVRLAAGHFPRLTMGAQDASRADPDFLREFIFSAEEAGATRIRISDTVGMLDPFGTVDLISPLVNLFPGVEFEFHGHNDLGLATANALAALHAGAHAISATVNGIGERAGNSSLEEVIANLMYRCGESRFKSPVFGFLSSEVSRFSRTAIPVNKPVVGSNAFRHESGIHTTAIRKSPASYQLLDPEAFGAGSISYSQGKHSSHKRPCHLVKQ